MSQQDNKPFQWTSERVKEFLQWLPKQPSLACDLSYLMDTFVSSHSSSEKVDWEIVTMQSERQKYILFHKQSNGKFVSPEWPDEEFDLKEDLLENKNGKPYSIHSVRRLSDGEVFSIGDRVRYCPVSRYGSFIIEKIWINSIDKERCMVSDKDQCLVETIDASLEKIKAPTPEEKPVLFTTEDGVPIYDIDQHLFWVLATGDWKTERSMLPANVNNFNKTWKAFSTDAARKEYILLNKPCFSVNDIVKLGDTVDSYIGVHKTLGLERLKQLASSKIQGGEGI